MRRVNPHTLEIEEVNHQDKKEYVYVISETGSWDYEQTSSTEVFKDFDRALDRLEQKITEAKKDMKEWIDQEDIEDEKLVDRENYFASYEIYERGDFSRLHDCIVVEKKEVK